MSETNPPAGQPVRHIVFDIGKVLIHYDPNIPYSRLIPDEAERAAFFRKPSAPTNGTSNRTAAAAGARRKRC